MDPDTVILSPHFDDAVLSCWRLLAGTGEVLVVNVFAAEPPAGTLGWWDEMTGSRDSRATVRGRIEEDRRALALAGRTPVNLPFLDGQYRAGAEGPGDIVRALGEIVPPGARIYAPGGLGDPHPDHIAVRAAALALRARGVGVTLYADVPHATVKGWPRWVLDSSCSGSDPVAELWARQLEDTGIARKRMLAGRHRLSAQEHAGKLQALRNYTSQLAPLQRVFESSLTDPGLLGFEVDWRLELT